MPAAGVDAQRPPVDRGPHQVVDDRRHPVAGAVQLGRAQRDHVEPVVAVVDPGQQLARDLRDGVGRVRIECGVLVDRAGVVAEHRLGGEVDDPRDAGQPRRLEQLERAVDVRGEGADRHLVGHAGMRHRGGVDDSVDRVLVARPHEPPDVVELALHRA